MASFHTPCRRVVWLSSGHAVSILPAFEQMQMSIRGFKACLYPLGTWYIVGLPYAARRIRKYVARQHLPAGTSVCYNDRGAVSFPSAHGLIGLVAMTTILVADPDDTAESYAPERAVAAACGAELVIGGATQRLHDAEVILISALAMPADVLRPSRAAP